MAKNYIPEIAKMLGVEIGEEVDLIDSDGKKAGIGPHRFIENGILNRDGVNSIYNFHKLLIGEYTLQKLPWKPVHGEIYRYIHYINGIVDSTVFHETNTYDLSALNMGNCFPTKEAAEAGKEEILAKFEEIRKGVRL